MQITLPSTHYDLISAPVNFYQSEPSRGAAVRIAAVAARELCVHLVTAVIKFTAALLRLSRQRFQETGEHLVRSAKLVGMILESPMAMISPEHYLFRCSQSSLIAKRAFSPLPLLCELASTATIVAYLWQGKRSGFFDFLSLAQIFVKPETPAKYTVTALMVADTAYRYLA